MYKWVCKSDDGAYEIESKATFKTKREAYDDMRNSALEKMKWNTEYDEDFEDDVEIGYHVSFSKEKIIHESYSGIYTYEIKEVKTFSVTLSATYVVNADTYDEAINKAKEHADVCDLDAGYSDIEIIEERENL